jgi:arginine/serine-rich splicing factor 4/5/6
MTGVKIWVGNVPQDATDEEIKEEFREFGPVLSVQKKDEYCFVELEDRRSADEAIRRMNNHRMKGIGLKVQLSNDSRRKFSGIMSPIGRLKPGEGKICIENLPLKAEWQEVKDFFRRVGTVMRTDVVTDQSGKSTGTAIVIFEREEDARRAASEMDGADFEGHRIRCSVDTSAPKHVHTGGSERNGGGDRERGRNSHTRRSRSRSPIRGGGGGSRGRSPSPPPPPSRDRERGRELERGEKRVSGNRGRSREDLRRDDTGRGDYQRRGDPRAMDLRVLPPPPRGVPLSSDRLDGRPIILVDERGFLENRSLQFVDRSLFERDPPRLFTLS